jgi:hypothetical protein
MNNFLIAVGISYKPLYEKAWDIARKIGKNNGNEDCNINAFIQI